MLGKKLFVVCIVLSLAATACSGVTSPKKVKVAASVPFGLAVGKDIQNAMQLALDQAGGKAGKVAVELVVFNTSEPQGNPFSPDKEKEAVSKAIEDAEVVAYLGPVASLQAKVSLPLLNQASVAQVSQGTTWPGFTKPGYGPGEPGIYYPTGKRHFFRVVPSDEVTGAVAARWAKQLGAQNIYIVNESQAYGNGIAGVFEITAKDLGLKIIGRESFDQEKATEEELKVIAARAVQAKPDLLYFGGGFARTGGPFILAVRKLDSNLKIMGPDGLRAKEMVPTLGNELAHDIYVTTVSVPIDRLTAPAAADFMSKYKAAYGVVPEPVVGCAYEAMKALLQAIGQAKEPTRKGVLDALQGSKFSGILGDWHFDERGDISITDIGGMQLKDGAWTFVQVLK